MVKWSTSHDPDCKSVFEQRKCFPHPLTMYLLKHYVASSPSNHLNLGNILTFRRVGGEKESHPKYIQLSTRGQASRLVYTYKLVHGTIFLNFFGNMFV